MYTKKQIDAILKKNKGGVKIDLGCGNFKQKGFVGIDAQNLPGVDIVCDLEKYPWPLPDNCADLVMASHLLEHINPTRVDTRLVGLLDLLKKKKLISDKEVKEYVGEYSFGSGFIKFMNEIWRITKPGGIFIGAFPEAGSFGDFQDPTHVNHVNMATMAYFCPEHQSGLWSIYTPMPWRYENNAGQTNGNIEVGLRKLDIDKKGMVIIPDEKK